MKFSVVQLPESIAVFIGCFFICKLNDPSGDRIADLQVEIIGSGGIFTDTDRKRQMDLLSGIPGSAICFDRQGEASVCDRFSQGQSYIKRTIAA